jgi:hypothetical protein
MNWPMADVFEWFEKHAGLGGWVGAAGAIIAIFVTWGLARAEYQRARRLAKERMNGEVLLFERITREFQPLVARYIALLDNNDNTAQNYRPNWEMSPLWNRLVDLNRMPITQWPSIESYDAFKRYFLAASNLLQTEIMQQRDIIQRNMKNFDGTYETLQKALEAARG